jgi:hypothetical protein
MSAAGVGGTDSLFSRCASLTRPGGAWDGTGEDSARNARDYWWQGWKGKGWELTNKVEGQPWVPVGSTVGPRFLAGIRGSPQKIRQWWVQVALW